MFSVAMSKSERIFGYPSYSIDGNVNKFHNTPNVRAIFVDLMKIFTQYEKINYIGCDGRSTL